MLVLFLSMVAKPLKQRVPPVLLGHFHQLLQQQLVLFVMLGPFQLLLALFLHLSA
jgi:hypothetical protein